MMRLDKLLSHSGYGTRKEVKEFIRKGLVLVNGEVILNDDCKVDEINDDIIIANEEVNYEKMVYIMLNKPSGYVSATFDNNSPTVLDLISGYEKRNLFPVGRLDKDTEGLLIISNDGGLAHKLLSPKNHVSKKYYLKYDGKYKDNFKDIFNKGIQIDDYFTKPAIYEDLGNNEAYMTIYEGKFHQVKKMMEYVNCNVTYLERIKFGNINLDSNLKRGEYRLLTKEEIELLKNSN